MQFKIQFKSEYNLGYKFFFFSFQSKIINEISIFKHSFYDKLDPN